SCLQQTPKWLGASSRASPAGTAHPFRAWDSDHSIHSLDVWRPAAPASPASCHPQAILVDIGRRARAGGHGCTLSGKSGAAAITNDKLCRQDNLTRRTARVFHDVEQRLDGDDAGAVNRL